MGLFFDILSAINNPEQKASVESLSTLTDEVQQVATRYGLNASETQSVISTVGSKLRTALQQDNQVNIAGVIAQLTNGNLNNLTAIQSLLPQHLQEQLLQELKQKIGLTTNNAEGLLFSIAPIVLKLLNLGAPVEGSTALNPVLTSFLDNNQDGEVDLGDVFKLAGRFLNAP